MTQRSPRDLGRRIGYLMENGRARVIKRNDPDDGSVVITIAIAPPGGQPCGALLGSITHGGPNQHCRLGYGHLDECEPDVVRRADGTIGPPHDAEEART